jgi:hypothetical protein
MPHDFQNHGIIRRSYFADTGDNHRARLSDLDLFELLFELWRTTTSGLPAIPPWQATVTVRRSFRTTTFQLL